MGIQIGLPCHPERLCDLLSLVVILVFVVAASIFIMIIIRESRKPRKRYKITKPSSRNHSRKAK